LKVTVSRIEEERETKGSRLVELEARVTELDQKLQEAVQAEGTVKVQLDRFKRHAQFQKGKLDALGKEKEEASKEIESLTKQIEELRSNAGMSICDIILANVSPNRLQHCDPVAMLPWLLLGLFVHACREKSCWRSVGGCPAGSSQPSGGGCSSGTGRVSCTSGASSKGD
jgi:hypothetical protein